MLRRAVGRALSDLLGDRTLAALPADVINDLGRSLTVEVEIAGPPAPVLGRTWIEAARRMEPGRHGAALRRGDRWAHRFPAQARLTGDVVNGTTLTALALDLELPRRSLAALLDEGLLGVYAFETLDLAQFTPDGPPRQLVRGAPRVPMSTVSTTDRVAAMADAIAAHIGQQVYTGDEPLGLLGDYHVHADVYEPLVAPALEQALVVIALQEYATAPGVDAQQARASGSLAGTLLVDLGRRDATEPDPLAEPAAAALCAIATVRDGSSDDGDIGRLRDSAALAVEASFAAIASGAGPPLRPAERAIVLWAAAELLPTDAPGTSGAGPETDIDAAVLGALIAATWASVPEHQHVALLPWLGWAECTWADRTGDALAGRDQLQDVAALLRRVQVSETDESPDLAGGYRLGAGGRGLVTAQGLRPAAFLATALTDPRLTPADDALGAVGRQLRFLRFVRQLMITDELAGHVRNPERATGGIRGASWKLDQPLMAQALGLITVSETLRGLKALEHQQEGN